MGGSSAQRVVEVRNDQGLHMRPAMQFVDRASRFESRIILQKGHQKVDGKSIMQISMLAATKGTKLTIMAEGKDAIEAVDVLAELVENYISEDLDNVGV